MFAPLRTALLITAVTLVCATSAAAMPTLGAPTVDAKLTTPYPTFTWSLPAGEYDPALTIAPTAKLVDGHLDDSANLAEGASASPFTDKLKAYTPGDYYWQVRSNTDAAASDFHIFFSPVQRFDVPAVFQFSRLRAKVASNPANGLHEVELNGLVRCNMTSGSTRVSMQVLRGKQVLSTDTRVVGCFDMQPEKLFHNFQPRPRAVPNGTKLTIQMTARSGAYRSAAPTTLNLTWRN